MRLGTHVASRAPRPLSTAGPAPPSLMLRGSGMSGGCWRLGVPGHLPPDPRGCGAGGGLVCSLGQAPRNDGHQGPRSTRSHRGAQAPVSQVLARSLWTACVDVCVLGRHVRSFSRGVGGGRKMGFLSRAGLPSGCTSASRPSCDVPSRGPRPAQVAPGAAWAVECRRLPPPDRCL